MSGQRRFLDGISETALAIFLLDALLEDEDGNPLAGNHRAHVEVAILNVKRGLATGLALIAANSTVAAIFDEARRTPAHFQACRAAEFMEACEVGKSIARESTP